MRKAEPGGSGSKRTRQQVKNRKLDEKMARDGRKLLGEDYSTRNQLKRVYLPPRRGSTRGRTAGPSRMK